jgi:hypothetical protein
MRTQKTKISVSVLMDPAIVAGLEERAAALSYKRQRIVRVCDILREAAQGICNVPSWRIR